LTENESRNCKLRLLKR